MIELLAGILRDLNRPPTSGGGVGVQQVPSDSHVQILMHHHSSRPPHTHTSQIYVPEIYPTYERFVLLNLTFFQ